MNNVVTCHPPFDMHRVSTFFTNHSYLAHEREKKWGISQSFIWCGWQMLLAREEELNGEDGNNHNVTVRVVAKKLFSSFFFFLQQSLIILIFKKCRRFFPSCFLFACIFIGNLISLFTLFRHASSLAERRSASQSLARLFMQTFRVSFEIGSKTAEI